MDLSLIIPLFNEEESLPELEQWIRRVVEKENFLYEILFIDDGSTDTSWQVIKNLTAVNSNVKGLRFRRNYGKSAALNEGFRLAQGRVVITMDADLQDSPDEIPELYNMIVNEKHDLVSGWKKKRYDPLSKTIPSKFFNWTTRKISGIKLHDFNCGLKAYSTDVVKNIEVHGEMHRYIPLIAKWEGFVRIGEKEVQHRKRKYGKTKFGMSRLMTGFLDLLSIMFKSKFEKRPMHLFGSLGSLLFLIGFIIAGYLIYTKIFMEAYKMTERPLFYFGLLAMIIGTQLFMTGFLSDLITDARHNKQKYRIFEKLNIENHDDKKR
ncbi:MAG: glycosyltransferase family 2 protein [Lentimicrobiaceae bacterium]|nr:glycosyltransferase family 2 protein [Lentimicrobiaceae bacterium]